MLTVLMTTYNGSDYVRAAIQSVLDQSYSNFEFMILDDASIDDTVDIIKEFDDDRIELIQGSINMGQTGILNLGLEDIDSKYIARIDQDDIWHKDKLQKQIDYMEANPTIAVCGTWAKRYYSYGITTIFKSVLSKERLLFHNPFVHSSVMFRTNMLKEVGGYPSNRIYGQDFLLILRLVSRYKGHIMQEIMTAVRIHDKQAMNQGRHTICFEMASSVVEALRLFKYSIKWKLIGSTVVIFYLLKGMYKFSQWALRRKV